MPIELEAALERLYPDEDAAADRDAEGDAHEDDTERLKDLASEAPVIRLVNQLISAGGGDAGIRHPYRAVRGPPARALPL